MKTYRNRIRQGLRIEWLEERNAPSRGAWLASALETLHHHGTGREHVGRVHDVRALHQGGHEKDDGANHNVNDQRNGQGKDDAANHDQNDNRGVSAMSHDDPPNHDTENPHDGHGHDNGTGHH
jgi:hypothetical protein